jgi:hypothetical protein
MGCVFSQHGTASGRYSAALGIPYADHAFCLYFICNGSRHYLTDPHQSNKKPSGMPEGFSI